MAKTNYQLEKRKLRYQNSKNRRASNVAKKRIKAQNYNSRMDYKKAKAIARSKATTAIGVGTAIAESTAAPAAVTVSGLMSKYNDLITGGSTNGEKGHSTTDDNTNKDVGFGKPGI